MAAIRSATALAWVRPFSARCRPGARPGSILPVVGVVPWRTSRIRVAAGALALRVVDGVRTDAGTGAHRRLCAVALNRARGDSLPDVQHDVAGWRPSPRPVAWRGGGGG